MASTVDSTTWRVKASSEASTAPRVHPSLIYPLSTLRVPYIVPTEANATQIINKSTMRRSCAAETATMVDWRGVKRWVA